MTEGAGFRVSKENVLQIGGAFAAEADRMAGRMVDHAGRLLTAPALGDPASDDFAVALNARLVYDEDSYVRRANSYVDELRGAARECANAARSYGFTDEQIESAMGDLGGRLD